MKKNIFYVFNPFFLYSQNLEELVNLSINNKMVNASQQSLDSIKDEYKKYSKWLFTSLDVGATYATTNEKTTSVPKDSTKTYATLSYELYDGGKKYDTYDSYESTIKK